MKQESETSHKHTRKSYLKAVRSITQEILNQKKLDELLTYIIQKSVELVNAKVGAILLLDEAGAALELKATVGYSNLLHKHVKFGEGLVGKAWREKKVIMVNDYSKWPGRLIDSKLDGVNASVGVPLKVDEKVIGVFLLSYTHQSNKFTPAKVQALKHFAHLAALSIKQATLRQKLEHELHRRIGLESKLHKMAYYDPIIELPNRNFLFHKLKLALQDEKQTCHYLFIVISLEGLNVIYEFAGSEVSDVFLKEFPQRVSSICNEDVPVIYLGGNKFVVVQRVNSGIMLHTKIKEMLTSISLPWLFDNYKFYLGSNIGIASFPRDGNTVESVMKCASIAWDKAKLQGINKYETYKHNLLNEAEKRLVMKTQIRNALINQEFFLEYQPRVSISGRIQSVEALLRWKSSHYGIVLPGDFIPILESEGLIIPVGNWVLQNACRQLKAFNESGIHVSLSVNLSPLQFTEHNLVNDIMKAIHNAGINPQLLEIEITETACALDFDYVVKVLNQLKSYGVRIAMDDFGVGQSSLINLHRLPIDTLKIDKSFIRDIETSLEQQSIVKTIIHLGKVLGLNIVAEGVETSGQFNFFKKHPCDEIQGYYFYKPMLPEVIEIMDNKWRHG